ncbi:receptor-like serine/threonine-protein kinase ALE2 [Zingiber officinale]|uniref:receptor-like serine/threonine-protein kinase ALE2 n=1 Tax=Zingiber officinale TaxID=94328 RepID=UPI001C4BF319|nr:receptor-like serine/threonine-protein kinase ALE2 [Zingiber officinale]
MRIGWRWELSCVLVVVVTSAIFRLEGFSVAPLPASLDYPSQKVSSPAQSPENRSAFAPRSVASLNVSLPTYDAVPPSIRPVIPSVLPSSPSTNDANGDKWPRDIAPSTRSQPSTPVSSGSIISSPRQSQPSPSNKTPIMPRMDPKAAFAPHAVYFYGPSMPPAAVASPVANGKRSEKPIASPPVGAYKHLPLIDTSPSQGSSPMLSPVPDKAKPSNSLHGSSVSHAQPPEIPASPVQQRRARKRGKHSSASASPFSPPPHISVSTVTPPPEIFPKYNRMHHASPPSHKGSSVSVTHTPAPSSSTTPYASNDWSNLSPMLTPPASYPESSSSVEAPPMLFLPPPPPNLDCTSLVCEDPLENPPPGSSCVCVLPIRVGLRLNVTLYTFFPLVPEFAEEVAFGIYMNQSQVRIMGANVATEQSESTVVLIDLIPVKEMFDNSTALFTFEKFWHKDIAINTSLFGDYTVLYVLYPGLPQSPPIVPADSNDGDKAFANNNNLRAMKPLGVDVGKPKKRASGTLIAVIVLSCFVTLLLGMGVGAVWLLQLKQSDRNHLAATSIQKMFPLFVAPSGTRHMRLGRLSSESASINSNVATYTGQAKTFTLAEIERATKRFEESSIIGEGGFGLVYQGTLEDGTRIAVKVLKRDDQQSGREFFAEIEMLSRLHHRNLVKLIGICVEEHIRCLIYELIPNGSLESHLHGFDKETSPLDWGARLRIALGAARGLAYLHEDSSPRVIHRDFKSSNILLEHDYTPKVSDFGLARAAFDEGSLHISTRVMGTFGYVAPEYAMTGHLLVKSDVYSYGVVLLELLTGRKPVDMLQPPGQENLVVWARPLLTNMDNLVTIIDPALGTDIPLDSVAKVAAIASMCIQPEVSHRPFMGEIVQALNLVCQECDGNNGTRTYGHENLSTQNAVAGISNGLSIEAERVLLESCLLSSPISFNSEDSDLFRRQSSSGPLIASKNRQFWQKLRSTSSTGSMSEHGEELRFWSRTYLDEPWNYEGTNCRVQID